uniref:Uncharacterized protein n=1 Tax=Sphaerodactylus townsendi TaxID=933632 RepID=A0ACB8FCU7_9SAUR
MFPYQLQPNESISYRLWGLILLTEGESPQTGLRWDFGSVSPRHSQAARRRTPRIQRHTSHPPGLLESGSFPPTLIWVPISSDLYCNSSGLPPPNTCCFAKYR